MEYEWTEGVIEQGVNKEYILQNSCSTEYQAVCMIQISKKYQWQDSILVILQAFSLQPY